MEIQPFSRIGVLLYNVVQPSIDGERKCGLFGKCARHRQRQSEISPALLPFELIVPVRAFEGPTWKQLRQLRRRCLPRPDSVPILGGVVT